MGVNLCMCIEFGTSGFIQNGYFLCVFGLGFWGFRFALAMLVLLWALWCNRVYLVSMYVVGKYRLRLI